MIKVVKVPIFVTRKLTPQTTETFKIITSTENINRTSVNIFVTGYYRNKKDFDIFSRPQNFCNSRSYHYSSYNNYRNIVN